jgi:hypothetical protein
MIEEWWCNGIFGPLPPDPVPAKRPVAKVRAFPGMSEVAYGLSSIIVFF